MKLLIAEDDPDMQKILKLYLQREGCQVNIVDNGRAAIDFLSENQVDLVILDWMMPVQDGIQTLKEIRLLNFPVKVLMLTAKGEIENEITGLTCGADDYLPKPFDVREFLARVRSLTRRGGTFTPQILTVGNVSLNRSTFELSSGGTAVRLGNKEFQMMELLMRRQGQFISTEQFMERIWGYECDSEINVVWAYISYLRRKLASLGADVKITASRGRGYMLEAEGGQ